VGRSAHQLHSLGGGWGQGGYLPSGDKKVDAPYQFRPGGGVGQKKKLRGRVVERKDHVLGWDPGVKWGGKSKLASIIPEPVAVTVTGGKGAGVMWVQQIKAEDLSRNSPWGNKRVGVKTWKIYDHKTNVS